MPRSYWRVSPAFWSDEKVTGAESGAPWSDETRLLAVYLLTCEHRTAEGLFRIPKGYIMEDLGWSPERLAEPFTQLLEAGFIEYDGRARLCLIVNALEYQSPENPNQVKAAVKMLSDLPQSSLFGRLYDRALQHCPALAVGLAEGLPERLPEGFAKPPTPTPTPTPTQAPSRARSAPVEKVGEDGDRKRNTGPRGASYVEVEKEQVDRKRKAQDEFAKTPNGQRLAAMFETGEDPGEQEDPPRTLREARSSSGPVTR